MRAARRRAPIHVVSDGLVHGRPAQRDLPVREIADGEPCRCAEFPRSRGRRGSRGPRQPVQHPPHRCNLQSLPRREPPALVEAVVVAPPVPARLRVERQQRCPRARPRRRRLRVENDQVIVIRPRVVAGVLIEGAADLVVRLPATVEGDMHTASLAARAGSGHVGVAIVRQRDAVRRGCSAPVARELALREADEFARGRRLRSAALQIAVEELQHAAGGIVRRVVRGSVATEVEEVAAGSRAEIAGTVARAAVDGDLRVRSVEIVLVEDAAAVDVAGVVVVQRIRHRRLHEAVVVAVEKPDALSGESRGRVDPPAARPRLRHPHHPVELRRCDRLLRKIRITLHAAGERGGKSAAQRWHAIERAEIRSAGRGADALHDGRMRDAELHRHVSARRDTGHRGFSEVDVVRPQSLAVGRRCRSYRTQQQTDPADDEAKNRPAGPSVDAGDCHATPRPNGREDWQPGFSACWHTSCHGLIAARSAVFAPQVRQTTLDRQRRPVKNCDGC